MSRIYTKTGDKGITSLLGGKRVRKDNLQVDTYGTIDEASSALGLAYSLCKVPYLKSIAREIQQKLITVAAELAQSDMENTSFFQISEEDVKKLEKYIDDIEKLKPRQKGFILPGGTPSAAAFDFARSIIRRAERRLITLGEEISLNHNLLKYINRLSDLLFVMARLDEFEDIVKKVTLEVMQSMSISLDKGFLKKAQALAETAEEHAKKINVPMVISVVDTNGNLVLFHRMDDSLLASIDISVNKAYTAVAVRMPTHELGELSQPGQALYGIEVTNKGRMVIFGGGYPLYENGKLVGGLGISGGTVEEDMEVAEVAIKKVFS
ncbi:MAG: hypothetical protein PWQ67_2460 [Clostridia bacterium]|nr:hypothetical protein [Clostridia bacterium]